MTDAETIANLRADLRERDAEIYWLREQLRDAEICYRQAFMAAARLVWEQEPGPIKIVFKDPE